VNRAAIPLRFAGLSAVLGIRARVKRPPYEPTRCLG